MPEEEKKSEDVLELLDSLEKDSSKKPKKKAGGKKKQQPNKKGDEKEDEDIMGFLDSLAKSNQNSGKSTPIPQDINEKATKEETDKQEEQPPPETGGTATANTATTSDEHSEQAVQQEGEDIPDPIASLSSWWSKNKSGLWNSATSAVKQAEARVRELQPENSHQTIEELGDRFGFFKSALSGVLDTIAPPIGKHEQLKIHIFHDMVGYPAIDTIVYNIFDRVMQQVEGGGELTMVVQKGRERHRRGSDHEQQRDLNMLKGDLEQAKKLAAANVEDYLRNAKKDNNSEKSETQEEHSAKNEEAANQQEPSHLVRTSDIYLSIQPIAYEASSSDSSSNETGTITPTSNTFSFVIYLSDPDHDISFNTVSQSFPYQWSEWLDKPDDAFKQFDADPRDWVIDWVEEGLGLAVGIVAQSYVTKRMGVDAMFS